MWYLIIFNSFFFFFFKVNIKKGAIKCIQNPVDLVAVGSTRQAVYDVGSTSEYMIIGTKSKAEMQKKRKVLQALIVDYKAA